MLDAGLPLIARLTRSRFERVVYLGSESFKGLAREAALKLLELSDGKIVALAETPLGFRHGPKTIVNGGTLVVMFLSNDPYARRYEVDVLRELRADGVASRVVALHAAEAAVGGQAGAVQADAALAATRPAEDIAVPGSMGASDLALCFPYAMFAQTLAFLQSLNLGTAAGLAQCPGRRQSRGAGRIDLSLESIAVRIFLGIDGGGTKTDFLLIDESGRALATHRAGSAYYLETGVDALRAMLAAGIQEVLQRAAVPPGQVAFTFIGLPAHGEDSALLPRLDGIAADVLPVERHRCGNDMVCGWAGALAGRDGINVVAGTGSIAYGEFESRRARAGGWGEMFGDEGSAYWIAREALTLFSRMSDGRAPRAALYELIREHFELRADLDVCAAVYGPPPLARSEVAALAPVVARAAAAGDAGARRLFERAALELAAIVHAVRERLGVPPRTPLAVSYSGGMFRLDGPLRPLLEAALRTGERRYEFVAPRLPPSAGAALYAAKLAGAVLSPEFIAGLGRGFDGGERAGHA